MFFLFLSIRQMPSQVIFESYNDNGEGNAGAKQEIRKTRADKIAKQKIGKTERPVGPGILRDGSHVIAVTQQANKNMKGNSVRYTAVPGRHYEKVKHNRNVLQRQKKRGGG